MDRQTFWTTEFSQAAAEIAKFWDESEDNIEPEEICADSAYWADLALAEFDKRFNAKEEIDPMDIARKAFFPHTPDIGNMFMANPQPHQCQGTGKFCNECFTPLYRGDEEETIG